MTQILTFAQFPQLQTIGRTSRTFAVEMPQDAPPRSLAALLARVVPKSESGGDHQTLVEAVVEVLSLDGHQVVSARAPQSDFL